MSSDALQYALGSLGCGVLQILGEDDEETPRAELLALLADTFRGADELKGALEEAFERSLQSLVVGLKQAWLLMETGGEEDLCESFGERLRTAFVTEEGIEGRLFIDFLDGFFLDYDTALDAASGVLGLPDLEGQAFFEQLLEAGSKRENAQDLASRATESIRSGFTGNAGLEDEHPIVRLGCWRDLLAEGLHYHFTDLAKTHPIWSRYLELFNANALERESLRAIVSKNTRVQSRIEHMRQLNAARDQYAQNFGLILPNREWLFDIAERLEDTEDNVESDLLKGRTIAAADLPKIVAAGVSKVHNALGTSAVGRLSDVLNQTGPGLKDVLRRARRDFRRSHWGGDGYGDAALQLAGAMLPLAGPRAAERYYREARAFGADAATSQFGLYLTAILSGEFADALEHLKAAAAASPEQFELFDFKQYPPEAILGAGGGGPTFLVSTSDGNQAVVKTFWDPVSVVDPRPGLRPLATILKSMPEGYPHLLHLGVQHKEFPYVVTEFVEGDDLESFREARGGDAPPGVVANVGLLIAARLEQLHSSGKIHGNLKPGNVRIGAGEEGMAVTLTDPGVPNVLLAAPGRVQAVRKLLAWSRVGRVIAEDFASYTAPEIVRGAGKPSASSDLYGLGGVLYRLSTGAPPRKPDPGALPSSLREIVMRCLGRDPSQRPGTITEVIEALRQAAENPDAEPGVVTAEQPTTSWSPDSAAPPAAPTIEQPGAPALADPFGAPQADPFGAPPAQQVDPFGAPTAQQVDPFGAPAQQVDPFGAPAAGDPFAPPAPGGPDPFATMPPGPQTGGDPFAPPGGDPFGGPTQVDPFGAPAGDPFAAPAGADPFGAPAGDPFAPPGGAPADPFGAPAGADPFGAPAGADPFGAPAGADPFGAPTGADPFGAPAGADPFGAPAGADPFGGPTQVDPFGAPAGADPFGAPAGADPFGAPAGADPFGAPAGADPFGAPAGADPFGAPAGADPFAVPAGADPFAAAPVGADPFAAPGGVDPFAAPVGFLDDPFAVSESQGSIESNEYVEEEAMDPGDALALLESLMGSSKKSAPAPAPAGADPFAQPAGADPFAQPAGADPFAQPAGADPFAQPAGADPFAQPAGADPFAQPAGADPFAQPAGADPFAQPAGADPFAQPAGADPFAQPAGADPFAAPAGADPFAQPAAADPFAAPAGADPFAQPAAADPFAAAAGGGVDPFAAAAGGGADPFAQAAGGAAAVDPFAAAASGGGAVDPFAQAAGAVDPFAAAAAADPFAQAAGGGPPDMPTTAGGLWLSDETMAPGFQQQAAPAPAPTPAPAPKRRKKAGGATYGVVISGLGLKSKKEAAVKIIMEIKGVSEAEARDMCRSPVVPVLKGVTQEEADAAEAKFKAAKVNCRVTSKKRRKK